MGNTSWEEKKPREWDGRKGFVMACEKTREQGGREGLVIASDRSGGQLHNWARKFLSYANEAGDTGFFAISLSKSVANKW